MKQSLKEIQKNTKYKKMLVANINNTNAKKHAIIIKSLREGGKLMSKTIYRRVFLLDISVEFSDINWRMC